jgi:hypothetical protein
MEFHRRVVAESQKQDCKLTLRNAIEEFYHINEKRFSKPDPKTKWTKLLVHHDVGHVFFGVNTTVMEEAVGDYWSLFGTDMTIKEYGNYAKTPEGKQILKNMGFWVLIKVLFLSLPLMFKVINRSRKMSQKWDHKNYEQYLDLPLYQVRETFNLQILS